MKQFLLLYLVVSLFVVLPLRAQVVADGATRTLTNVTNTITGTVTVGTNGSFTLLTLGDNALLTNSVFGDIGHAATAKSNEVRLVSATSRWLMGSHLFVGTDGSFNRLVVSNGAKVFNNVGVLSGNSSASNNLVLVTGTGSTWSNRSGLNVGNSGAGNNRLIIEAGGQVFNVGSLLGGSVVGSNNAAIVTGNGSLWKNLGDLSAGFNGSYNTLVVSNGGMVISSNVTAGTFGDSRFNQIAVTGSGSTWSNQATFRLGDLAGGHGLLVNGGATLQVGSYAMIGHQTGADSNSGTVTDSGSRWLIGTDLYVGSNSPFNRLTISNGGFVTGGNGVIGQTSLSRSNEVVVTGAGSLWSNRLDMAIGAVGSLNRVAVSDGGRIVANNGFVGNEGGNCEAILFGAGSTWSNRADFFMGIHSAGNRLVVSNAARVVNNNALLGFNAGALGNLALVSGPDSLWSNRAGLVIGHMGPGNRLEVRSGGGVRADGSAVLGSLIGANFNTALVTDPGSSWLVANQLLVGSNSAFNSLVVGNSGQIVSSNAILGFQASASNNTAIVTGAGSLWNNAESFHVGFNGAGNQLIVSNGATVLDRIGEIGGSLGNSNAAVVTGSGSVWSNSTQLVIGRFGSGNRLLVSNGGHVESPIASLGANLSSSNSTALVTDSGSSWDVASSLAVGGGSVGNRMVISNGAWVRAGAGTIGFSVNGGSNNEAVVTGPGSTWTNQTLSVGGAGPRNRLVVTNGGLVAASGTIAVGAFTSSSNNRVVVDTGTLRAANVSGTGSLDVRRGTNVLNAGLIDVDVLLLTNTLGRFEFNGGTLVTRGADIRNTAPFTIGNAGSIPAVWDVRAGASNYFLSESVVVGLAASFAQLIHTNGALLTNDGVAALGVQAASRSNTVTLAGSGSRWLLSDGAVVGEAGSGNHLVVSNGASLITGSISYLGQEIDSSNNEAVVTGPGSSWFTANYGLRVGDEGRDNRLLVSDGGVVTSFDDWIGVNSSSSNNLVRVTGMGSLWNNTRELSVGLNSSGNQLVVSNGATVFTVANKYVGRNDGALSNTAIVTGPGSAWLGDDGLCVGLDGSFNRLFVRNGGRVTSGLATLGGNLGADGNLVLITEASSVWSNRLDLNVGDGGSANQLLISNGGAIISASAGFIGRSSGASSNVAVLTDVGTRWLLNSNLYVGSNGAFGQLLISNGARVENGRGSIGTGPSSSNNLAVVTGSGSVWNNANELFIGVDGRGNQLVVSNGGVVISSRGGISENGGGRSNLVVVTGSGSIWSNAASLTMSGSGGSRLLVSDGALVRDTFGSIGAGTSASNNAVLVTGPGSEWRTTFNMSIGGSSSGNQLVVSNGGAMFVGNGFLIGSSSSSTNNRVVIEGGTLRSTNSLGVSGYDIRGGTNILNAGVVEADRLLLTNTLGRFEFNGGTLITRGASISNGQPFVVGGPGGVPAIWEARAGLTDNFIALDLLVGSNSSLNQLLIPAGGIVTAGENVIVGALPAISSNNLLHVASGTLRVQNAGGTGTLDVRSGTTRLDTGLVDVDRLVITNTRGQFEFNGGALSVRNSTVNNGQTFRIGNGSRAATFNLAGNGVHTFAGGLTISQNSALSGNGSISGTVVVESGGTLRPGTSIGTIVLSNVPALLGTLVMEISKNSSTLTNDQLQLTGPLIFSGSLIVSNLGPTSVAAGDRFPLFSASSFGGAFASITLPPLAPGFTWRNDLAVDGSITVVGIPPPGFSAISLSGTNLISSGTNGSLNGSYVVLAATNVALPLSNWVSIATNQFDSSGSFSFTNAIDPGIPQRFFQLRTP